MNSPIRTALVNNTDNPRAVTCVPRRRIVIAPKSECIIDGDIFSLCENTRSVNILLDQVTANVLSIYFIVDSAFEVKSSEGLFSIPNMTRPTLSEAPEKLNDIKDVDSTNEKSTVKTTDKAPDATKTTEQDNSKSDVNESSDDAKISDIAKQEEMSAESAEQTKAAETEEPSKSEPDKTEQKKDKQPEDKPKATKKVQVK